MQISGRDSLRAEQTGSGTGRRRVSESAKNADTSARARRPSLDVAVDRVLATRVEQGLPPTVTDPVALARIASILRTATSIQESAADHTRARRRGAA